MIPHTTHYVPQPLLRRLKRETVHDQYGPLGRALQPVHTKNNCIKITTVINTTNYTPYTFLIFVINILEVLAVISQIILSLKKNKKTKSHKN